MNALSPEARHAQDVLDQAELVHDEHAVNQAVRKMAARITADLAEADPLLLCVMNGGLAPTAMLMPYLVFPWKLDYLHATRYREQTSGTELIWQRTPAQSLTGRHVLVIDDILDEGHTLEAILHYCKAQEPASLRAAVLTQKIHDRGVRPPIDYIGLTVPDRYVFGCGMDYRGYWRNLPAIYALPEHLEGH
jgi:hypoxanthine phosphoribosyltransferase